jgi:hypothetical protein
MRELYQSSNGDRWHLVRQTDTGRPYVSHEANQASGGKKSYIEIGAFLVGGHGPEQQELLRLIATLADEDTPALKPELRQPSGPFS